MDVETEYILKGKSTPGLSGSSLIMVETEYILKGKSTSIDTFTIQTHEVKQQKSNFVLK